MLKASDPTPLSIALLPSDLIVFAMLPAQDFWRETVLVVSEHKRGNKCARHSGNNNSCITTSRRSFIECKFHGSSNKPIHSNSSVTCFNFLNRKLILHSFRFFHVMSSCVCPLCLTLMFCSSKKVKTPLATLRNELPLRSQIERTAHPQDIICIKKLRIVMRMSRKLFVGSNGLSTMD